MPKMELVSNKNTGKIKVATKADGIKTVTHLYLHYKRLKTISNLSVYENLQVLYLHNNDIKIINNLDSLTTLKHLYLQKNKITKIEGLSTLKQLRKLYLGCNEISVIEGLDKLLNLEELHIEKQQLNKGESLCFDPRSIYYLSETLHILNVSHNNLTSIESLSNLKNIRSFNASYNNITDVEEVGKIIHKWYYLTVLNFIGNPMTKQHRYKDALIANAFRLDNKDINENTRLFIKRFEHEKSQNQLAAASNMKIVPKNLPGSVAPNLQKAVSTSIMKNLSGSFINNEPGVYVPWQALKPSVSDSGKIVPPLFVKHQRRKAPETKKVHFLQLP